jgi:murein DD-endopeptidase MepM/ murein hydrolase activator NlpD
MDWLGAMTAFSRQVVRFLLSEVAYSTAVCLVVWTVCRALRGRWPALRQALWALVLLRLVLPPSLSHSWSAGALLGAVSVGVGLGDLHVASGHAASTDVAIVSSAAARADGVASGVTLVVVSLWLAVVVALVRRDLLRAGATRSFLSAAEPVRSACAGRMLERWMRRLGVHRPVRLVSSAAAVAPFTVGLLRPTIFVPAALLRPGKGRAFAAALGHELAHVARWDYGWLRLQQLVSRLFFFHPVVWLASRQLNDGRECLCDALVVAGGLMAPRRYVGGLLDVLQLELRGGTVPALFARQKGILMRLTSALAVKRAGRRDAVLAAVVALAVGWFLLPLAGAETEGANQAAGPNRKGSPMSFSDPLPGRRVAMAFGEAAHPITGKPYTHRGVDLVAPAGTKILAPHEGVVELATESGPSKEMGTVVIVDHGGGWKTAYAHLGELKVARGQHISGGDVIAFVGSTGLSTGPHLHFEVWEGGQPIDPATVIQYWRKPAPTPRGQ